MDLKVIDIKGKETSKSVALSDSVFAIEPNDHAIYLDVKQHLAAKRQGTHSSKERADISGSTRKLKKQKGTGGARAGSIKNPLFRGGGRVFGPQPRNYDIKLNAKVKKLARKSALTYKAKENGIIVLSALDMKAPKTKDFMKVLTDMNLAFDKVLFVVASENKNAYLSSRNIQGANVVTAEGLNTYEILNANKLVIIEEAVGKIESVLN
ncbi:MAG: 50S ribosomal protein L4 [Crocinitomicaceae bacterium]|jgi:large subunit ribosomal protein L4|nr:50S ribosomal protein L4 [Crocinitomicaceae bacterium]MBK6953626.1 50S ribosomal protein L4 [Crocinitomicaceae bacterium]MBK9592687.1 50S ribosomal protein L4 [Crocinitomicaceae bacterium]